MAVSYEDTTANGSQTDFNIISVQASSLYTFISTSQIRFTTAPSNGVVVRVGRNTPQTVLTDFSGGAILPESDLDNGYLQMLYSIQELQDQINELHP
jgi:hypothetical protein